MVVVPGMEGIMRRRQAFYLFLCCTHMKALAVVLQGSGCLLSCLKAWIMACPLLAREFLMWAPNSYCGDAELLARLLGENGVNLWAKAFPGKWMSKSRTVCGCAQLPCLPGDIGWGTCHSQRVAVWPVREQCVPYRKAFSMHSFYGRLGK